MSKNIPASNLGGIRLLLSDIKQGRQDMRGVIDNHAKTIADPSYIKNKNMTSRSRGPGRKRNHRNPTPVTVGGIRAAMANSKKGWAELQTNVAANEVHRKKRVAELQANVAANEVHRKKLADAADNAAVRVQACTGEGANNDVVGQMYTNKELVSQVEHYRKKRCDHLQRQGEMAKKCCDHLQRQGEMTMEIHGLEVELANQETKFRAKLDAALRRIKQLEQKRDPISPPSPVSPVVATAFVKTQ